MNYILIIAAFLSLTPAFSARKPNIILILTDDQGYGDLGCYGSENIRTPRIDQMAKEGLKLTSFYAGAPLCGPSRAALLTGCYSQRLAERNNEKGFHTIIDKSEVLIPEILKPAGYATAAIGKWHIAGSSIGCVVTEDGKEGLEKYRFVDSSIMPHQKGFDYFFGTPYSNDMRNSVLIRDNEFVEELGNHENQIGISTRYTDEALHFIESNQSRPFFLYLAHNMPHAPLWPSKRFEGKSADGFYGDCIEEIDWNVGRILDTLRELSIDENTLVIFTSDNGPAELKDKRDKNGVIPERNQGGHATPLRGVKMTSHEGGSRVPCVIRFPGQIKPGRISDELVTALDFFPTIAGLAGAELPADRKIDGLDISAFLTGKAEKSPREDYYFYKWSHLHAVRDRSWKLVLPREAHPADLNWYNRLQEEVTEITLYNLKDDISETTNVARQHPEVVDALMKTARKAQAEFGDGSRNIRGSEIRLIPN